MVVAAAPLSKINKELHSNPLVTHNSFTELKQFMSAYPTRLAKICSLPLHTAMSADRRLRTLPR